ncbi:hypothetical protein BED35_05430 [Yersinia enterocolitica]|nr:hypothetical protein BED34_04980 [Yersinia enterocolitica]AOF22590.1 hypothetical protein BED33_07640 [Yersinia enterocolitica]AOF26299.1 hypothetical protein BED32_04955 [Yersinia enterocolitica]AOF30412.1 hypothetical protein BED35_05430 [Yersinia enterocolitica]AOF34333.1 hypothetical protein BFS78_04495 [Yersinia enterocolitica]
MSPSLAEEVNPQSDGSVLIDGSANVRELNKAFNWSLPVDARTINGMLLEELEDIPQIDAQVRVGNYLIDVLDVQENMIKRVRVTPILPDNQAS